MVKQVAQPYSNALPADGFGLLVDGKIKSQYDTREAALKAGLDLKRKFPKVQVALFDGVSGMRMLVEEPAEA
jgi:hypothetical protein